MATKPKPKKPQTFNIGGREMTMQEIRQFEIDRCKKDVVYFVEKYGHIEDKDADELIQKFTLWQAQKDALLSIVKNKWNVILKARQLGFSWLTLHVAAWMMVCNTGRTVVALSRTEEEAKELVRRLGVILRYMPSFIAEDKNIPNGWSGPVFRATAMELTIYYPKGPDSVFKAFPSAANAARSFTADLIIFDEWAFQDCAEKIWTSGFPTINRSTGGKVIGLSTIERGSHFENMFTNVDNGFNKIFIPWYADPRRDEAWYEQTKRALGDAVTQEYPATIEEALSVPGGAYFPEVMASTHLSKEQISGKVFNYVTLDYGLDMLSVHWIRVNSKHEMQVYREYDAPNVTIGAACDIIKRMNDDDEIELYLAPSDLWSREQITGRSRAELFRDGGINLTKTSRDFPAGCANMKELLRVNEITNRPQLTILDGTAPNLYRCLQKIQKDKHRPNIYAKTPHELTHDVDSLRSYCVFWTSAPEDMENKNKKKWTADMWEDYWNASEENQRYLIAKWGDPM